MPRRPRFADLLLTALAAVPFGLAYAFVTTGAACRWTKQAWLLGAERAAKRWNSAG